MVQKIAAIDFETILYLVFAIVGGLYSYFQKKNKESQKRPTASKPQQEKKFDPIEEFLKNINKEEKETVHKGYQDEKKEPTFSAEFQKEKETTAFEPVDEVINYQFKEDNVKPISISVKNTDNGFQNIENDQLIRYQVNGESRTMAPRDLVIANTIFNRPYT